MEQIFHGHFYSGDNEAKLTDLISVRQGREESIHEYFKRFKDIKNRCFNLSISEKDLADLALVGLHSHFREKLEGFDYFSINQLQVRALGQAYRFKSGKDTYKTHRSNTHVVEYDSDSSSDEDKEVYTAEFDWPSAAKPSSCHCLSWFKRIRKKR